MAHSGKHRRVKRAITKDMTGFNHDEKLALLWKHNDLRSLQPASDMMYMAWDDRLAETAQKWVEECKFEHSSDRDKLDGYNYVGENLYAGTHEFDPADVVQAWYDEITFYDYETRRCTDVCGHYTQVVWANSRAVGCGVKYCPVLTSPHIRKQDFSRGYIVACHYGPGGNYVQEKPYSKGDSCAHCPMTAGFCVKNLCAKRPKIGSNAGHVNHTHALLLLSALVATFFIYVALR